MIKSGGEWMSSQEIENAAVGHPQVAGEWLARRGRRDGGATPGGRPAGGGSGGAGGEGARAGMQLQLQQRQQ